MCHYFLRFVRGLKETNRAGTLKMFLRVCYEDVLHVIVSDETSQKVQWRSSGRINDLGPGLSGLLILLAVIGGKYTIYSFTSLINFF